VGKHKVDIRFRREDEQTTFEVIKGNPQAGRALPSGVKVSTAKDRLRSDLADNAPRKQSIVRHNNAPNPCRSSYRRQTIIDHRLLVSAYRHGGDAGPPVRFNQLTTVRFNLQSH
jgi:hypothetical protein